jgi:glycosyltransferase involved in cell wall biosynthesis
LAARILYSIDARFGGSGIGYTAYNAVLGIYQAGGLRQLFINSNAQTAIPRALIRQWGLPGRGLKYLAAKDQTGLINYLENLLFDAWVGAQISAGDICHGWNGMCRWTFIQAKRHGLKTIVERASSHPATQLSLLEEEYQRWGVTLHLPRWNHLRSLIEINRADYILIPSAFVRQSMLAAGVSEHKLIEIPFGADLGRFSPTAQSVHPFRVIFAGQVSLRKGLPYLLQAWQRLGWSDAELWIVGSITPEIWPWLKQWINFPGVSFIHHTSNVERLFQQSDLFVFPTIEEGSALVVYEALACGLPVITTPNAGSVVRNGEEGLIVPIRDVEALCLNMQRLREEVELRRHMQQAARKRIEEFTWAHYQARLIEAYKRIGNG